MNRPDSQTKHSEQNVLNASFDRDFNVLAVELLGYNSSSNTLDRITTTSLGAFNTNDIEEASATVTYIGKEDASGAWYIQKIDTSSGTAFTYATITNNPTLTSYALGWAARTTATYGTYAEAF